MPVLIFDYDGTIHDTIKIYEPAFRKCHEQLIREGYLNREEISSSRICGWLGKNVREMWEDFAPQIPGPVQKGAAEFIGTYMHEQVLSHQALWYPGIKELLEQLKSSGYEMVILSNSSYMDGQIHWKEFEMGRWFLKWYDCESFGWKPKSEIIWQIVKDYPGNYVVIGDRESDIEAAKAIGCPSIGCSYGYGSKQELLDASVCVSSVTELSKLLLGTSEVNPPTGGYDK